MNRWPIGTPLETRKFEALDSDGSGELSYRETPGGSGGCSPRLAQDLTIGTSWIILWCSIL